MIVTLLLVAFCRDGRAPKLTTLEIPGYREDNEEFADEAFHLTNAPESILTDKEKKILGDYHKKLPSLSVGDIVYLETGEAFRCDSIGWTRFDKVKNIC